MAKVEGGQAVRGIATLGLGLGEGLGANAINPPLVSGFVADIAKTVVDTVFHGASQGGHDLGGLVDSFGSHLENGPGGILGGLTVLAGAGDGLRRIIIGGADIKEGFGKQ